MIQSDNSSIYPLCIGMISVVFVFLLYKSDLRGKDIYIPEKQEYKSSIDAMENWREKKRRQR